MIKLVVFCPVWFIVLWFMFIFAVWFMFVSFSGEFGVSLYG